ncbi:MAG: M20/M25/M40 family metallo-hydrolase, partial [Caulobacterales bacterium]
MNTVEILSKLISFDTTSRNSNLELIVWVEDFLRARGIPSHRVMNEDGSKANLYALIGPEIPGGVVLSGHTDVVPVDGQDWRTDPFKLESDADNFYGRGVADMKSFIALALAYADAMRTAPLKKPVIFAFSYDEEVGCLGAPHLIEQLALLPKPGTVIVGEPTLMKVVSGHKGISVFRVEVEGREAHSSQTGHGVSAVMEALKLMKLVEAMAQEAREAVDHGSHFHPPE